MAPLEPTSNGRLLCFDFEARPLAFWYDGEVTKQITAFGWKWSNEPRVHTMVLRADRKYRLNGRRLLDARAAHALFADTLAQADLVYGHNIRRYDMPLFHGWLLRLGLPRLKPILTTDTLKDLYKRGPMSASLASLARGYDLEGEKLSMTTPDWELANELAPDGVARARERVTSDVLLQEQLRSALVESRWLKPPSRWSP